VLFIRRALALTHVPVPSPHPRSIRKLLDKYARFIHLDHAHTTQLMTSLDTFVSTAAAAGKK
jgi:hypothetical protein